MAIDSQVPSGDWLEYVAKLERRVQILENGRTLRGAVIPAGGMRIGGNGPLVVETDDGVVVFYVRDDGTGTVEFGAARDNGVPLVRTVKTGAVQTVALCDNGNNVVAGDDPAAGQGLARPALQLPTRRTRYDILPSSDSATFDPVLDTGYFYKQHPKAYVQIIHCASTSGTTGEAQLMLDGVQVGSTISVAFSLGYVNIGPFAIPGTHMSQHQFVLFCRRTAGTGRIGADMTIRMEQS